MFYRKYILEIKFIGVDLKLNNRYSYHTYLIGVIWEIVKFRILEFDMVIGYTIDNLGG